MSENDVELSHGMHVVHDGPPQAPPLLLIHGSGAAGGSWGPMIPALVGHHHVIRVDLPGCGKSPPAVPYDVPGQAGRLAALLDDLGLHHVPVAGHSSGGYVATALAEQRPELVRSLALISTGPPLCPLLWAMRSDAWIRSGITATTARPVDVPDDLVAGVQGTTYRAFRKVLGQNAAYITARPRRSPGSRPRQLPSRRGSRSTTSRGRMRRRPGAPRRVANAWVGDLRLPAPSTVRRPAWGRVARPADRRCPGRRPRRAR